MKRLLYSIFALLCNLSCRLFPIRQDTALFISMHNEGFRDSLGVMYERMLLQDGFGVSMLTREDLSPRHPLRVLRFFFSGFAGAESAPPHAAQNTADGSFSAPHCGQRFGSTTEAGASAACVDGSDGEFTLFSFVLSSCGESPSPGVS